MQDDKGEPLFCGKDVAVALGYKKPENAIAVHVEDEDKTSTLIQGSGSNYKSQVIVINESGLYSLILSSKLDSARRFKRWVTSEVLPQIRKNGRYELEQQNRVLESRNALLEEITAQQKPLTDYARIILSSTQTMTIT